MNGAEQGTNNGCELHSIDARQLFEFATAPTIATLNGQASDRGAGDQAGDDGAIVRRGMTAARTSRGIVGQSKAICDALAELQHVAPTNATVLLLGETGVGKEVFAEAIHETSPRRHRPMIRVSCAALPSSLIESELFGYERGAFTGAACRQVGRFEAAQGATIFLDEIGDVPLETQVKLLRVLEQRTIDRLGGSTPIKVDVRIIAATNRDLEQAVRNGTFREDLYYRLNVFPIVVPPLRERVSDIPGLAWTFIDDLSAGFRKRIEGISARSLVDLQRYNWPGNVRELRNVIERAMILAKGPTLVPTVPRGRVAAPSAGSQRIDDIQAEHIKFVLDSCRWRVRGFGGAAEQLGMKPTSLESRMAKLGIRRKKDRSRTPMVSLGG